MGQISVSITKRIAFRDSLQEFSNVYTYGSALPNSEALLTANEIIDDIVASEKKLISASATFVHARMWSSGGTISENQMLYEKDLTGTGTPTAEVTLDRERAILFQWPAGKDSRGRTVYLRKWYHICGISPGGAGIGTSVVANLTGLSTSTKATLAAIGGEFNRVGISADWGLIAESGRERDTNDNPIVHPYLEHRQLGDMWRG